jgi:general secretion pathway protein I
MVTSPINFFPKQTAGLTLIEVLIALAIVSIAMTAIIKAVSQNIRSTHYLQNKTIAMYVGQQVLNEARVGILEAPLEGEKLTEKTEMFGADWYWQAEEKNTPNQRIKKMTVSVYGHPIENDETPIISMDGYVYEE